MQPLIHSKLETTYFAIFQKLVEKFGGKAGDPICFDVIDQFHKYHFYASYIFCFWGKRPFMHDCREIVFIKSDTSDYLYLLKIIIRADFLSTIVTKP